MKKSTTFEFIEKAKKIHGDKYDYSKVNYKNNNSKIIIICKNHGEFLQTPMSHLSSHNCMNCYNEKRPLTTKEFIEKSNRIHHNFYDYSKTVYINNHTKIKIICPKHGCFNQIPSDHLNGHGCPNCRSEKISKMFLSNTKEFIKKSKKIYRNKYDYSKTNYINSHIPIIIGCRLHGEFKQKPVDHLRNICGCPMCSGRGKPLSTNIFIEKSKKIHGDKYDYSLVNYKRWNKPIKIICKKHGVFKQRPNGHIFGQGCPKCKLENDYIRCNKGINRFIKESKKIHNNKYDYSQSIYTNNHKKLKIICPRHGHFYQTPHSHLNGNGCPKCSNIISKSEIKFLNFIKIPNNKKHRQKYIGVGKIKVDGIINNVVYEFLGDYYHGNPQKFKPNDYNKVCHKTFGELYKNTIKRFELLKQNGYNVKYIWENDWKSWYKNKIGNIPMINY